MNMTVKKWDKDLCRQLRKGHKHPTDIKNAQLHYRNLREKRFLFYSGN